MSLGCAAGLHVKPGNDRGDAQLNRHGKCRRGIGLQNFPCYSEKTAKNA
jgi:hypothetical protein